MTNKINIDKKSDDAVLTVGVFKSYMDEFALAIKGGFDRVDERFDGVDKRLDKVEDRLEKVENRIDGVENRLNGVENGIKGLQVQMNSVNSRLDDFARSYLRKPEPAKF